MATTPETCTRRCKLSEDSLTRITTAVLAAIAERQTSNEESIDQIGEQIRMPLESRIAALEDQSREIETNIQNEILSRYGPILGQLEQARQQLPGPVADQEGSTNEEPVESSTTVPSESPLPHVDTDRPRIPATTPQPQLRPDPYRPSPDCPQYDWCEPLRIWITQLVNQFQQASVSATANPQMRYYERQNQREEEQEQEEEQSQRDLSWGMTEPSPPLEDQTESLSLIESASS